MLISDLPDSSKYTRVWTSPYDFNNTFAVPHIYALVYEGEIKYVGQSNGNRANYYTGGVIPRRISRKGVKGVLEFCSVEELNEKEIKWIAKIKPEYNICEGGSNKLYGDKNPAKRQDVKQKISEALKNKEVSKETKQKLREAKLKNPVRYWKNKERQDSTKVKIAETYAEKNKEKYAAILTLTLQGFYVNEIVKMLGVSTSTVAKVRKLYNLSKKHARNRRKQKK